MGSLGCTFLNAAGMFRGSIVDPVVPALLQSFENVSDFLSLCVLSVAERHMLAASL